MNVLDNKRYQTLTKEFIDLVIGNYGVIQGDICPKLLKKVEKNYIDTTDNNLISINSYKNKFKRFCSKNNLDDLSKSETDLLNYILFTKEAKEFYISNDSKSSNNVIGLQEGFGLYID